MIDGHTRSWETTSPRGSSPELYDYWDFYYDWAAGYTGDDIDMETYVCDTLGVCREDKPGNPGKIRSMSPSTTTRATATPAASGMTRLENIGARSLADHGDHSGIWVSANGRARAPTRPRAGPDTLDDALLQSDPVSLRIALSRRTMHRSAEPHRYGRRHEWCCRGGDRGRRQVLKLPQTSPGRPGAYQSPTMATIRV